VSASVTPQVSILPGMPPRYTTTTKFENIIRDLDRVSLVYKDIHDMS
jgi:hypothetical protein